MKATQLDKGQVYMNVLDIDIPLEFTGRLRELNEFGVTTYVAYFKPVKTEKNKNWYNTIKVVTKCFDSEFGNGNIKTKKEWVLDDIFNNDPQGILD